MKKKKWRDVKNALVMVVVMAAMMSTATYAWFTLTGKASVTGMQMTAGGSSGLKVSATGEDGTYVEGIDLKPVADANGVVPENPIINQLTIEKTANQNANKSYPVQFYKPVYTGEKVTGLDPITKEADIQEYAAMYTYYLKTDTEPKAKVGLVIGAMPDFDDETGLNANNVPNIEGSFVRATKNDVDSAVYAVRIGLVVTNEEGVKEMYVYEPNNDGSAAGAKADAEGEAVYATRYDATVSSDTDGNITVGDAENSAGLFTVTNTGTRVDMYVWLEGTDNDCTNNIKADEIEAQVQFELVATP